MSTEYCDHGGVTGGDLENIYFQDNEFWNTGCSALTSLAGITAIGLQLLLCTSYSGRITQKILQATVITGAFFGVIALVASKFFYPKHYPNKEESTCKICKELTPFINQKIEQRRKIHSGMLLQGAIHIVGCKFISGNISSNILKISATITLFFAGFLLNAYLSPWPNEKETLDLVAEKKIKDLTSTSS